MSRLVALFLGCAVFCAAQTTTGTLQGRVTDPSSAAVPDAKVSIRNEQTGVVQNQTTNEEGRFVQPFLLPGQYEIAVEKTGFQRYSRTGIRVEVQQNLSVDVELSVGDVGTTIQVDAAAPPLTTNTSSLSTVISNKQIVDMPLNGRNPFNLALLAPGVVPSTTGASTPWISGGRNASSEITIDGTSIIVPENNVSVNATGYTPNVDSVEEFSVVTNSLSAEYGRTGGGVINVATKQGTNEFHGVLYEFLRNSELDANNFFANRANQPRGAFQRNQFGGTLGGPIWIPGLYDGRNRTFFFLSEQSTLTRSQSVTTQTVPLPEWLRGDFSNLRNASGQPIRIYDPLTTKPDGTRDPFPGNIIPPERIDPVSRALTSYFPAPNTAPTNPFTQANNFTGAGKSANDEHRFDVRIDHNFTDSFRMFGRASYGTENNTPVNFFGNDATPQSSGPSSTTRHNYVLNGIYAFNPTTILNTSYGFTRFFNQRQPFSQGFDPTTIGLPASIRDVSQNAEFPRFNIAGVNSLGQDTFTTLRFVPNAHVVRADVTKVLSSHTVKFGGEYRKMLLNFLQLGQPAGQFDFNQGFTQGVYNQASSTAGFGLASFLLGYPSGGSMSHDPVPASASDYMGFFVQDDWRATQSLTFNIGLRYDVDRPRTERYNRYSYFDIDAPSPIAGMAPGYPDLRGAMRFTTEDNRRQTPTDWNNWGPRFGFAWRLGQNTVARGAYGLMYSGSVMQAAGSSGSAGMEGYRGSTPIIASVDANRTPATQLSNPFPSYNLPQGAAEGPNSGAATNLGLGIGESFFNDYVNPVIQQWNFTLQRQLPGDIVIEGGYIGSKGNHLIDGEGSMTYNQLPPEFLSLGSALNDVVPNPFFGIITNPSSILSRETVVRSQLLRPFPQYTSVSAFRKPQANSLYHGFTIRVEKRYSNGLSLLLAFTGSKLIDDASQVVTFLGPAGNKQDFYNRRAERAVSAQDVSRRLVISGVYDLPFGRDRKFFSGMSRLADALFGGWQVNGILTIQNGTPVIITQNQNNTGLGTSGQRPNNIGMSAEKSGGDTNERISEWFDTSVFTFAPAFTFGTVGRTLPDVRNPGIRNLDASLFKNFRFTERVNLQFRAEAFNLTNTPQFGIPGSQLGGANFGVITGYANGQAPRQVQLALKLLY
jgi:Carboxypeptidase regulatory-like domain